MASSTLKLFNILSHQEMQIKTVLRALLTPARTADKKTNGRQCSLSGLWERASLFTAGGKAHFCSHMEISVEVSQNN